ncbi:MAG: hypothetical protein KGL39_33195 [Patescibacteria group bacterium]|nr:hypothetical protein [Patescibacteria group bacterium]
MSSSGTVTTQVTTPPAIVVKGGSTWLALNGGQQALSSVASQAAPAQNYASAFDPGNPSISPNGGYSLGVDPNTGVLSLYPDTNTAMQTGNANVQEVQDIAAAISNPPRLPAKTNPLPMLALAGALAYHFY